MPSRITGDKGINPSQLRAIGQATSLVGLIGLVYGGGGALAQPCSPSISSTVRLRTHAISCLPRCDSSSGWRR